MIILLLCLLLISSIFNLLLLNDFLQARSDSAWQRKQEERRFEWRMEQERQAEEERRELEAALDRLLQKVIVFEHDLFDTTPEYEAEIELYCLDADEPYTFPDLPELHRPFYEQFRLLEKAITFLNQRCMAGQIDFEEIDFYESLLIGLWNTYRQVCGRQQLIEFESRAIA